MSDILLHDYQAIFLSLRVALMATLLAVPVGFAVAYLMVFVRLRGKWFLDGLINLPLVLPPVVVGYLLLVGLGRHGIPGRWLAAWGIEILFTWKAAVIASMVVGFPLLVRAIRLGLEQVDTQLIQASRTLGAPWWDTLLTVILPLTGRSIIAGATLMFARSLGEFGATIIVAGNIPGKTQTIPLAIYDYSNTPGGEKLAMALCLVAIVLAFLVLLCSDAFSGKFWRRVR